MSERGEVTELLLGLDSDRGDAVDRLLPLVYDELKGIAGARLRAERAGHTLSATALVREAYIKLVNQERVDWKNRAHFFAIAALRFFAGLTMEEIAEALGVSLASVNRDWRTARAFLTTELRG